MVVMEWMLAHRSLLVLAAVVIILRVLLRRERVTGWLTHWLGHLGLTRDFGPLFHVLVRWGSTLALALILAQMAGLTTGVRAALGALGLAGLIIAFAGQHLFQNVLAGFLILLDGDMALEDEIEVAGCRGRVVEVELRSTLVRQEDGTVAIVPNTVLLGSVVKNRTLSVERIRTSPLSSGRAV